MLFMVDAKPNLVEKGPFGYFFDPNLATLRGTDASPATSFCLAGPNGLPHPCPEFPSASPDLQDLQIWKFGEIRGNSYAMMASNHQPVELRGKDPCCLPYRIRYAVGAFGTPPVQKQAFYVAKL